MPDYTPVPGRDEEARMTLYRVDYACPFCGVQASLFSRPVPGYENVGIFTMPQAPHCPCVLPLAEMMKLGCSPVPSQD